MIERRVQNLLELDYPADRLEIVVASDASTDGTDAIVERLAARGSPRQLVRCPRGGKVAAQNRGVQAVDRRDRGLLGRERGLGNPDALRLLVRQLRRPGRRLRLGPRVVRGADGTNREGAYWRFELWLRMQESRLGSITGRQWPDLRRSPLGLGRPRALVRPRPRASVPDGAAGPARGLRPGRRLDREAFARHRGRVPAQGAHDARRRGCTSFAACSGVSGPSTSSSSSRTGCSATGAGSCTLVLLVSTRRSWRGLGLPGRARRCSPSAPPRRSRSLRLPIPGAGLAYYYLVVTWATLEGSPATSASGRRCSGSGSRAPGEPRARRCRRVRSASRSRARCWPSPRWRSRSRTAGPCSTGNGGWARTGRVRAPEAADDGRRRGAAGCRLGGEPRRSADHASGPRAATALARRAAAALERRARRDEPDRPAADARVPGRAVHAAPAPAARRASRASPAGRRSTAAPRCRGRSGSSSTSGTSRTARRGST